MRSLFLMSINKPACCRLRNACDPFRRCVKSFLPSRLFQF